MFQQPTGFDGQHLNAEMLGLGFRGTGDGGGGFPPILQGSGAQKMFHVTYPQGATNTMRGMVRYRNMPVPAPLSCESRSCKNRSNSQSRVFCCSQPSKHWKYCCEGIYQRTTAFRAGFLVLHDRELRHRGQDEAVAFAGALMQWAQQGNKGLT